MMKLSNDISILTVALTIQKIHSSEKYSFKSPRFNAAYGICGNTMAHSRLVGLSQSATAYMLLSLQEPTVLNKFYNLVLCRKKFEAGAMDGLKMAQNELGQ